MNIFAHPYLAMFVLVISQPVVYIPVGIGVVIGYGYMWRWAVRGDRRDAAQPINYSPPTKPKRRSF